MRFVYLMDPLETVVFEKDTTFALMRGAARRGHAVYYVPRAGVGLHPDGVRFHAQAVSPRDDPAAPFVLGAWEELDARAVDVVWLRHDPPFDAGYLMTTWLLDRLPPGVVAINAPDGVRTANEKVWATQFADLVPRTLISARLEALRSFVDAEGEVVAKPTDGFGGQSVFRLRRDDTNVAVALETLSRQGRREIVLQQYVPAAETGDKRLLLLDGEILGAVLRVHGEGEHRNNFFSGGKPCAVEVTARDAAIAARLAPELRRLGLWFVGIDVIGEFLIEVNVTSPTCLQEMNRLDGTRLEDRVIAFAETRRKACADA